jgi:hypothetical protein
MIAIFHGRRAFIELLACRPPLLLRQLEAYLELLIRLSNSVIISSYFDNASLQHKLLDLPLAIGGPECLHIPELVESVLLYDAFKEGRKRLIQSHLAN